MPLAGRGALQAEARAREVDQSSGAFMRGDRDQYGALLFGCELDCRAPPKEARERGVRSSLRSSNQQAGMAVQEGADVPMHACPCATTATMWDPGALVFGRSGGFPHGQRLQAAAALGPKPLFGSTRTRGAYSQCTFRSASRSASRSAPDHPPDQWKRSGSMTSLNSSPFCE